MKIVEQLFKNLGMINLDKGFDHTFSLNEELLKKKGIESKDQLKQKVIEYVTQLGQADPEQYIKGLATYDKLTTLVRRMLLDVPNVVKEPEIVEQPKKQIDKEKYKEDTDQILLKQLDNYFPEKEISYGEWYANHREIVNKILTQLEKELAQEIGSKEEAQKIMHDSYWKIINHTSTIL